MPEARAGLSPTGSIGPSRSVIGGGLGLVDDVVFFVALVEIMQTHPCSRGGFPASNHPTWEKPP